MSKLTDNLGEMIEDLRRQLKELNETRNPSPDKIRLTQVKLEELKQLQKDLSDDRQNVGNYREKGI